MMGKKPSELQKNGKQAPTTAQPASRPTKVRRHIEPIHADDDPIYLANFPWKELIPGWDDFDCNTKNPALDKNFKKGHHTPGSGSKKKRDFERFIFGFCLEHVLDKDGNPSRCYNQFTIDSNQCIIHGKTLHKDGPNKIWKMMKDGKAAYWGMLKNQNIEEEEVKLTPAEIEAQRHEEMMTTAQTREEAGEDYLTVLNELNNKYKEEKALQQKISKQEAREKPTHKTGVDNETGKTLVPGSRAPLNTAEPPPETQELSKKAKRNTNQRGRTGIKEPSAWRKGLKSVAKNNVAVPQVPQMPAEHQHEPFRGTNVEDA
jgi:hypothetical protein